MYRYIQPPNAPVVENLIQRISDGAFIPFSPDNKDYLEYLKWLAEGNEPKPADE